MMEGDFSFDNISRGMDALATAINNIGTVLDGELVGSLSTGYPSGATPITASSGNVAAAAATATIAAVANKTNYLTQFIVTSGGSTAAALVALTVTGTLGGTMTFTYATVAGVTTKNADFVFTPPIPIPASAVNTAIVVSLASLGAGNTRASVVAMGFSA